ncbi:hypothetical protein DTO021D3_8377 [Paecilomyces variotii]|nr:hypothetical protein DTO032I3_6884 [Paecilomyces variotii]KAJ9274793.1 hypothetical protein DTO021D3_8377 [Paecilomyces variotii]KAJ9341307.1 hypothetical protein DTO027B6_6148 [Paecilomyces variotii]KAJ9378770.1 hypothetical protein DTO032I4_7524 [Paecilomyces variotii]
MASSTPSSQQVLIKRQSDNALMPPPPPPKRIKRPATVLDEDTYTDALSHIIARDFFPGLLETQTKQEYLDALESKDKEWIASAGKRLSEVMTPGRSARGRRGVSMTPMTPAGGRPGDTPAGWGGDTPMSVVSSASTAQTESTRKDMPDVSNMGLGAFQAKYTSEDNESFYQLLDRQNTKRRENYAWMWSGNKIPTARQIAHRKREEKKLIEQGRNPDNNDKQLVAITTDMDARPAKPDAWKSSAENSLMFTPSGVEDTHETVQQKAEAASRAGPRQVVYDNTRLRPESNEAAAVPPSPSISAIKDAIAGRPRRTDSEPGFTGGETPRVNGYTFVDEDEPEPEPEIDYLKLLTSTTSSDSTPNPFQIKENRKREELHHRMVESAARTKRAEKSAREIKTPVPRFPSSPMFTSGRTPSGGSTPGKTLTPAAQKLLQRVGSTPRGSSFSSSSSSGLRNMWTPTPKRK